MASNPHQMAQDLALKLRYEAQLNKSMRGFFRDMAKEINTRYKTSGQILNVNVFDIELNGILRKHYRKVSNAFEDRLRSDMQKSIRLGEIKSLDDKIKQGISSYFYKRSIEQTAIISATNNREVLHAFNTEQLNAAKEGIHLSNSELANNASDSFELRALGRAKTIGQTETQNIAEKSKDIEADILLDTDVIADGVVLRPENLTKTWSAILDDHTRHTHVIADDQTVNQDEPFIVGGYKLMFPGDDSLGAALEEIINCRCNTIRAVELAELPDFVLHPFNQAPRRGDLFFP